MVVYIPDLDILIARYLNHDTDLANFLQVNRYCHTLSSHNKLWQLRLHCDHPKYLKWKPDHLTWRQWYFFWRQHQIDPIGDQLKLDAKYAYIRILSERGLVRGSELFQTIDITLPKAFASHDVNLIEYFMDLSHKLFQQRQLITHTTIDKPFLDYTYVISECLNIKSDIIIAKYFCDLIDLMYDDWYRLKGDGWYDMTQFKHYENIAQEIGCRGLVSLFETSFLPTVPKIFQQDVECNFAKGLIKGRYNDEAIIVITRLQEKEEPFNDLISLLIFATTIHNKEMVIYLRQQPFYNHEWLDFIKKCEILSCHPETYPHHTNYLNRYEVFGVLLATDDQLAHKYYLENTDLHIIPYQDSNKISSIPFLLDLIQRNDNILDVIDYSGIKIPDAEALYHTLITKNKSQDAIDLSIKMLEYGRYDYLPFLINNIRADISLLIITALSHQGYRDLYLYILFKSMIQYPGDYFSSHDNAFLDKPLEMHHLITEISRYDLDKIYELDLIELLKRTSLQKEL